MVSLKLWKMSSNREMHAQPSPPAPAASAQLRSVHGASAQAVECGVCDYEDQLIEARRISWQACAAIFAGMLGILAIILEPVGFSQASGDRLIGPGVCGGAWCIAQAVWAGFLLFNARKVMTIHTHYRRIRSGARSPMSTSLQCNASALTTFTDCFHSFGSRCVWMDVDIDPAHQLERGIWQSCRSHFVLHGRGDANRLYPGLLCHLQIRLCRLRWLWLPCLYTNRTQWTTTALCISSWQFAKLSSDHRRSC